MNAYRDLFMPLFLLLPVGGLGYSWVSTEIESREGVVWEVPIAGYDPRDLLRGHYVQYRYQWPGLDSQDDRGIFQYSGRVICITGNAPIIDRASLLDSYDSDFEAKLTGCDSVVEYNPWSEEGSDGLDRDRMFLPQDRASEYQSKLNDRDLQAIARVRVNTSNYLIPVDIVFRPRSGSENVNEEGADDE